MAFHLYRLNELYSNADGSVQFIELVVGPFNGESFWQGVSITATQGGTVHSFPFPSNLPSFGTANTSVLIATQGFADLGIVTPNYIIPSGFLFTNGGAVNFAGVDQVNYAALPTDGVLSLNRDGSTGTNSPKNFAGATGTVQSNVITGTDGADNLVGTAADNVLTGRAGNDSLDGGAGTDIAAFAGAASNFKLEKAPGRFIITDETGPEGVDNLISIEKLQFADKSFELVNPPRAAAPAFNTSNGFLFDAVFYLLDNPELVPAQTLATAIQHYFSTGAGQGNRPNSWFDASYYENRWPDLKAGNFDDAVLFMHYNLYGVWEGRSAAPRFDQFDGNRYLTDNPDVAGYVDSHLPDFLGSRSNGAIAHFVIYGANEGRVAFDLVGQAIKLDYIVDLGG